MHTKSRACHTAQDSKQALASSGSIALPCTSSVCAPRCYPTRRLRRAEHLSQGTCTTLSVNPWTPPEPAAPKVIYGEDDRNDVYQETDEQHLAWAQCTCGLTDWSGLTNLGNGTYQLAMYQYEIWDGTRYLPPCSGEAFTGQPTAMWCSRIHGGRRPHCHGPDTASMPQAWQAWPSSLDFRCRMQYPRASL